ncbi:ribonuclease HI family protein [Candidatus Chromulinivorax destructor]|uniref:Ribonuclease H n=1 Tax=Candidatus Chromulinivorax destructor TaxID=2066483 RepID=A0A345ZAV7_9BACT|nr:ribonuclease HI family protein [Candidatus Chromulinivorax destructor]AXK60424.1 ribonuclease H [Candidatus Chromulinivorax destructor]
MKQMSLWDTPHVEKQEEQVVSWRLFIDGASKNNPGPAASGFVLFKNKEIICRQGFYLGIKTNNQAEYYALVLGIFFAKKYIKKTELLTIISDSQLLVRQMTGIYKVKDAGLRQLKDLSALWLRGYTFRVEHVLREYNKLADEMANRGVEKKISLPQEFLDCLKDHEITI